MYTPMQDEKNHDSSNNNVIMPPKTATDTYLFSNYINYELKQLVFLWQIHLHTHSCNEIAAAVLCLWILLLIKTFTIIPRSEDEI